MKKYGLILLLIVAAAYSKAQNLVPNPGFETFRPSSAEYEFQNPQMDKSAPACKGFANPLFRYSPAANWTIWLGSADCRSGVMTELIKAGSNCLPPWPNYVMGNVMHVKTTLGGSGIVNSDIPAGTAKVKISCWVYVVKGAVEMGYGPTGSPLLSSVSTTSCKWQKLEITKSDDKAANQVILYSKNIDAEFYVDAMSVTAF